MNEDYGNRNWEQPCICGHLLKEHTASTGGKNIACARKDALGFWVDGCSKFKLDNLALVEQIARARGLI